VCSHHRLRAVSTRARLCLSLLLALSAAAALPGPAPAANPPATDDPLRVQETLLADDSLLVDESLRVEDQAPAGPAEAAERMQALAARAAEGSALRREFLGLAGRYFASARMDDAALAVADSLDAQQQRQGDGSDLAAELIRLRIASIERGAALQLEPLQRLGERVDAELGPRERLRYWNSLASTRASAGELGESIAAYQTTDELADQVGHPSWQVVARSGHAVVLARFGQVRRAEQLARDALEIARTVNDDLLLSDAYTTLGIVLEQRGDSEGLLAAMTLAIDHARRAGSSTSLAVLLANVAHYHLKSEAYAEAERVSREALQVADANEDPNGRSLALANLGLARIGQGDVEEDKRLVGESIASDASRGMRGDIAASYQELAVALEKAGDISAAVLAFHRARELQDEIFREDQQRSVLALQEDVESRRRQKAIEQLHVENALTTAELERSGLQQWVWRLLAALLVLALALLGSGVLRLRSSNRHLAGLNVQLRMQSERDPLTGLANRRHVQAVVAQSSGAAALRGSLMLIDLDHFQMINDRHGHAVGDRVLGEVGKRLRGICRGQDLAARWGGEEFLLLLDALAPADAAQLASRLLAELSRPVIYEGRELPISASIGYATVPLPPTGLTLGFEASLRLADAALYLAKLRGRRCACGIRSVRAAGPAALDSMIGDLEHAEALGRVEIDVLLGEEE